MAKTTSSGVQYRVVAPRVVLGHEPGETFTAELSAVQEERLVASGHIERVTGSKANGETSNTDTKE